MFVANLGKKGLKKIFKAISFYLYDKSTHNQFIKR